MNFNIIKTYIENLYKSSNSTDKKSYISQTRLKRFIPVVDQDVSRFLALVIKMTHAKKILEIGTSIGYSTVSMANALKGQSGRITTVEYDVLVARQAQENFNNTGVDDIVDLRVGDAREILPGLRESFDLIFLDIDKLLYEPLLNDCIRLLKKSGVLIADDTLFPVINLAKKWHYLIPGIEIFNQAIANKKELMSTILPIGDGLTIAVKKH